MKVTRRRSDRFGTGTLLVGLILGALLAVDNLLGFLSWHLLPPGAASTVGAAGVLCCLSAVTVHGLGRRVGDAVKAASGVGFLSLLSPALGGDSSWLIPMIVQVSVPLGFAIAALLRARLRDSRTERVFAATIVMLALVWAVTAFVPFWLTGFLVVQALTLIVAAAETAQPLISHTWKGALRLWASAAIR